MNWTEQEVAVVARWVKETLLPSAEYQKVMEWVDYQISMKLMAIVSSREPEYLITHERGVIEGANWIRHVFDNLSATLDTPKPETQKGTE